MNILIRGQRTGTEQSINVQKKQAVSVNWTDCLPVPVRWAPCVRKLALGQHAQEERGQRQDVLPLLVSYPL
jgi:hypothetical protein